MTSTPCPPPNAPADADSASLALQGHLRAIARGDTSALRALHAATHERLLAEATRVLSSPHCAEEALQDAYLAVWRSAARFDPTIARPMTWLLRIVRNRAIDRLRARRSERETMLPLDDGWAETIPASRHTEHDGHDGSAASPRRLAVLHRGLGTLAQEHRQAVALALYRGLSNHEIAACCGVSESTARAWLRAGVRRLQIYAAHDAAPGRPLQ